MITNICNLAMVIRDLDIFASCSPEPLFTLEDYPVSMSVTSQDRTKDIHFDQHWLIDQNSGIVYLGNLFPLEKLYTSNHCKPIGDIWRRHHEAFSNFVSRFCSPDVLEIGGGHGLLSTIYSNSNHVDSWCIVEPNPHPIPECTATFIPAFFNAEVSTPREKYGLIVHSHVLEHVYEPFKFMKDCAAKLNSSGTLVFSIPNQIAMLNKFYPNAINIEHTYLLDYPLMLQLISDSGLSIVDIQYYLDDHSIFIACQKNTLPNLQDVINRPENRISTNRSLIMAYHNHYIDLVESLNSTIDKLHSPVFLFGAHVFAQHLLHYGLDQNSVVAILDNDISKHNQRLYGTNLSVLPPEYISQIYEPIVIVHCGAYTSEISQQLKQLNQSVTIL